MKLLIAEDDQRLLKSLTHILEGQNYTVDGVANGIDALHYAESGQYDGIVLDIMMPGMDGVEVLKRLRQRGCMTPCMFLTAKSEISQRVEGLDAGADDYLPKPFDTREFVARVRAMTRRRGDLVPEVSTFGELVLNKSTYELWYRDQRCPLSGKEYRIIELLMDHPGYVVTVDNLILKVWGWEKEVDMSVIWVHVSNLRKKVVSMGAPVEIRFVRGAGYKLEESK